MTSYPYDIWIDEADTICIWPPVSFRMGTGLTMEKLHSARNILRANSRQPKASCLPIFFDEYQPLFKDQRYIAGARDWLASRHWGPPLCASPAPSVARATQMPSHGALFSLF